MHLSEDWPFSSCFNIIYTVISHYFHFSHFSGEKKDALLILLDSKHMKNIANDTA